MMQNKYAYKLILYIFHILFLSTVKGGYSSFTAPDRDLSENFLHEIHLIYFENLDRPIMLKNEGGNLNPKPVLGFGSRIGGIISFGSGGLSFNLTTSIGVQYSNFWGQVDLYATGSAYMGGNQLGTSHMTQGIQWDATITGTATFGKGDARFGMGLYSSNYNIRSPFDNNFKYSITLGQAFNFNSAVNAQWDASYGKRIQRSGIIGFRAKEFGALVSNDANRMGDGGDRGHTGGIIVNFAGVEFGYQNFTGAYDRIQEKTCNYGCIYTQTDYHKSLNQSFYFVRAGGISVEGGPNNGGVQKLVHRKTNTGLFYYPENIRFNISGALDYTVN